MAYPKTYRAFRRTKTPYPRTIELHEETLPDSLSSHDVVIRIHAVSLNYRDKAMLEEGRYPAHVRDGGIPACDCAAEVVATGPQVSEFAVGDRVSVTPALSLITGAERDQEATAMGGDSTGVLREYAVFEEKHLVKIPDHLSWEEAATIPGAGISAWRSLDSLKGLTEGATAVLQGTGGVSMYALLICLSAGIRPIITSSSDEKLANILKLDPRIAGINYKTHPDITAEVLRITQGNGVDYVVNNVGLSSVPEDIKSLRKWGGSIALVGFLEGFKAGWPSEVLFQLLEKAAKLQGIMIGSRIDLQELNTFIGEKKIRLDTLIDRTFAFEDSAAALDYLWTGSHVGKIVIKIP
ncbi:unnamed protein product [Periconia digitata]|uniref:Enoyl reductase (ER) domain-containing protein n=1 Tax=Periconia digitata TaxID=1303443 RepID=A0A9W4URK5_9PLEO|nr:unnamed protein product [Periconia digitata]